MLEYKGYVIEQIDKDGFHDIVAYRNGKFAFQACTSSHLESDKLKEALDYLLNFNKNYQNIEMI